MLTVVPNAVNAATRQVVLRHPNTMDCVVWRKVIKRIEQDPDSGEESVDATGMPTLGGMGVMRGEDEADFDYVEIGPAKCLFAGPFVPTDLNERDDAPLQANMQEAQIACLADPGTPEYFDADTGHLVMITPGLSVVLAYEVVTVTGAANIPPYVRKLVLNPRDDLHALEPFIPEVTAP
jgi:hypothetical protein